MGTPIKEQAEPKDPWTKKPITADSLGKPISWMRFLLDTRPPTRRPQGVVPKPLAHARAAVANVFLVPAFDWE